jgi:hypothetical protein
MGNITPAKRALAALDTTPSDVAEAPKPISKKIRAAIDAMVAGDAKTITEAAAVAGLSREHLSRELGKPHITEHLRGKVLRNLALASARAGDTKVKLSIAITKWSATAPARSSSAWPASRQRQHQLPRAQDWSPVCKLSSLIVPVPRPS